MEWKARWLKIGHHNYVLIMLVAFLFILPQLITQNMVIGSDAIFHFNRFYDTSQQIKEFNFEYFMSLYGFQQSGRIVNAFYGPFMGYFHGFLVLISKNWFMYQVLSNFVLFALAGSAMYLFLRTGKLSSNKSFVGSIIYMSTFSILYWSTRQGFTSWGAAILPLCLMIVFDVITNYEIPKYKLGILTALLFQTHMLTSLFLILIYLPIYLYAFVKSTKKFRFLC